MSFEKNYVGIIGGGSWGTVLSNIVSENGYNVIQWMRDENLAQQINDEHINKKYLPKFILSPNIYATTDISEVAKKCGVIFVIVPSHGFREIAYMLGNYINAEHIIIHGTKGLEENTLKRMSVILNEETCTKRIGVLSGPNLAKEILIKTPTGSVIASNFEEVIKKGIEILSNNYFTVFGSKDIIGAELGGVFKNIIAIASGIIEGLELGNNTKAMLITRGNIELTKLGINLGADVHTFNGLSGIGDLIATCISPLSRNYQVGYRLAKGETLENILNSTIYVAEGIQTTKIINEYCQKNKISMPIVKGVYKILFENTDIKKVINKLMSFETGYEAEFIKQSKHH